MAVNTNPPPFTGPLSQAAFLDIQNGAILDGYMLVAHEQFSDGFRGQAWVSLVDPTHVVFAFGGTQVPNGGASLSDKKGTGYADVLLALDEPNNQEFTDAVNFYNEFLNKNRQYSNVMVVGHSLGGALAEYVAATGERSIDEGYTFEAPGIQAAFPYLTNSALSLIDYIDENDPVATFNGFNQPASVGWVERSVTHRFRCQIPFRPKINETL